MIITTTSQKANTNIWLKILIIYYVLKSVNWLCLITTDCGKVTTSGFSYTVNESLYSYSKPKWSTVQYCMHI